MKVVLIAQNSSYSHTNSALRIFRNLILQKGYDAVLLEGVVNEHGVNYKLLDRMCKENADVYMFSAYIWNIKEQLALAECIKDLKPYVKTVFGGPEVSYENEEFLNKYPFVDCLIKGEGESAVLEYLESDMSKRIIEADIYEDFETQPEPYVSSKYSMDENLEGKLVYYESSRGCPFSCSYCLSSNHSSKKRVRAKSAELAIKELTDLGKTKAKAIKLVDRTFNFDAERAYKIFESIISESKKYMSQDKYTGVTYHFEICADLLDQRTLLLLKSASENLIRFEIGIQSTDKSVLENIGRKSNIEKCLENIRILKDTSNITLHLDLISGLPGMTIDVLKEDFNKIYRYADMVQLGILKMLKGTEMRKNAQIYSMKYLKEPPYTILSSEKFPYEDLRKAVCVSDMYETLACENSGYNFTMKYVSDRTEDMFSFFLEFSQKINGAKVSRKKMYELLFEYLSERFDVVILKSLLRFDYYLSNQGRVMGFLLTEESENIEKNAELKKLAWQNLPENHSLSYAWTEVRFFEFDNENLYVIDRKTKCYHKINRKFIIIQ